MVKFHIMFHYLPGMTEENDSNCGCPVLAMFELDASLLSTGVLPTEPECLAHFLEQRGSNIL
jgi:hypothetical protein